MTAPGLRSSEFTVLCVDDNPAIADAIRIKLRGYPDFTWVGSLPCADELVETALQKCPHFVLLDLDMPGKDPLIALAELVKRCPETRVVIFSGHVRDDLVKHAIDTGAWGYVSKNDGEDHLMLALQRVLAGELGLSPEPQRFFAA